MLGLMKEYLLHSQQPDDLILVDECIFSQKTFRPCSWAIKKHNVEQRRRMGAQKAVAVVAAVSATLGLIRYERRPSSYTAEAFCGFL